MNIDYSINCDKDDEIMDLFEIEVVSHQFHHNKQCKVSHLKYILGVLS